MTSHSRRGLPSPREIARVQHDDSFTGFAPWGPTQGESSHLRTSAFDEAVEAVPEPNQPWRLPIINTAEWIGKQPPTRRWIVDGWLARGTGALLVGQDGVGKSLIAQQLATAVAAGKPFLGLPTTQCPTLYVTCEDDNVELWRRQRAINNVVGVPTEAAPAMLSSLVGMTNVMLGVFDHDGRFQLSPCFEGIEAFAVERKVGLIVLDNLAHLFTGNENIRREVAEFCSALDRLAIATDSTVVMIAHPSKSGAEYSGSTGWSAHVRQRWFMERVALADGGDRDARVLRKSKANYSEAGTELRFRWHQWAFATDEDLPEDTRAEIAQIAQSGQDNEVFLTCLAEMTRQERNVSERRSASFAPTVFAKMSESKSIGKDRLEAAMDRLFRLGTIKRGILPWKRDRKEVEGLIDVR